MKLLRTGVAQLKNLSFSSGVSSVLTLDMNSPLVFKAPAVDPWVPLNADWQTIGGDFRVALDDVEHEIATGEEHRRQLVG